MFKAFRTIPVMKEIISDMKELCPDAWLINFTNPSGIYYRNSNKAFWMEKSVLDYVMYL